MVTIRPAAHIIVWLLLAGISHAQTYQALRDRGDLRDALATLESAIKADSASIDAETHADYADLLFRTGQIDRAIEVAQPLAQSFRALTDRVRLAGYYRYRGRTDDFDRILEQSLRISRMMMQYGLDAEDWVAAGQLMELDGTDPGRVMAHYQRLLDAHPDHVLGLVSAGELALRTKGYDLAARYLLRALDVDGAWQPALSALAHTFYHARDPRLDETMSDLSTLNPKHPTLFLIQAERHLDLGDWETAHTVLDSILETNPRHIDALALKAAAYFLADDHDAMERTQSRIFAINPEASAAHRIPGRIASRHYRFALGKRFQSEALRLDPSDNEARLLLAFDLLRLGEDDQARPQLDHVFQTDPYNVQAYNLLTVSDALREFVTLEDATFRLQMPQTESIVLGSPVSTLLHEAADRYQRKYDVTLETPVLVQIFDDHDEFIVRSVGLPGSAGHLGICFGKLVTMDSPRARPPGAINWRQVLWHEFVHVVTLQKTDNRMPRWLSEGISVYEELEVDPSWGTDLDPQFKGVVEESGWPTIGDLERYFTQPGTETELMWGYYAAGAFVQAYVDTFGITALNDALDQIRRTTGAVPALEAASNSTREDLDALFQRHLETRCSTFDHLTRASAKEPYRPGDAYTELIKKATDLEREGKFTEAEATYLVAQDMIPDLQGRTSPLRRIVAMWSTTDSTKAYAAALRLLVASDAQAFDACLELARLETDPETVSWALDRAFAINPFDRDLLAARYEHARSIGSPESLTEIDRLIHLDDVRRQTHRLSRADLLAATGDTTSARATLLTLLEETPHDWPAQRLLLQLNPEETP